MYIAERVRCSSSTSERDNGLLAWPRNIPASRPFAVAQGKGASYTNQNKGRSCQRSSGLYSIPKANPRVDTLVLRE